jgi:type III secretory pathway component EscS
MEFAPQSPACFAIAGIAQTICWAAYVVGFEIQQAMTEIQQRSFSYTIHSHRF